MMVLVDTTVWIDFFSGKSYPHVKTLENLIFNRENICICGVILTEILQGIKNDKEFKKVQELLENLIFLPMSYHVFLYSAHIYRNLRKKGITIRKTIDCIIAAVAIEYDIQLLHNDKDFIPIEKYFNLQIVNSTLSH